MVKVRRSYKGKGKSYSYDNKNMETVIIDKKIKQDFKKFCEDHKINKSKLIEEFYKTILVRWRDGSFASANGYVTINILREPITKIRNLSRL